MTLDQHLEEFSTYGFTILRSAHDAAWVEAMRSRYPKLRAAQPGQAPTQFDRLLDVEPQLVMQAICRERVLALAEGIIGPHVQLESVTMAGAPPTGEPGAGTGPEVPGWHRDLFAQFPEREGYQRPLLFNAMVYLQDLTDAIGPLRVIPGSHRRPLAISPDLTQRRHTDEVLLYPHAGDAVVFHHALVHSGSFNRSRDTRYFVCVTYNHCWLKFRGDYSGEACQALIRAARARGDRRVLRLLGADEQVITRALHHAVLAPEAATWSDWQAQERCALAASAAVDNTAR